MVVGGGLLCKPLGQAELKRLAEAKTGLDPELKDGVRLAANNDQFNTVCTSWWALRLRCCYSL
jgi:hypothetical protein